MPRQSAATLEAGNNGGFSEWATVTNVTPVEKNYTIRKPVEKCWTETVRVEQPGSSDGSYTNELLGGLLGGVIGNQFGGGSGKDAMTLAGAALGASVANDQEKIDSGRSNNRSQYREVEQCETVYETEKRREVSHYIVNYSYSGHNFSTKMNRDPGDSIRVRVKVTPQ